MSRSNDTFKAAIAEINAGRSAEAEEDAEERAINYLATLPIDLARGAAVKAAMWFFAVWEAESQKALWCRDPSLADRLAADDRAQFAADLAVHIKHVLCQPYPDECIRELLQGLTPVGATWVASALVDHVCSSER